jgi:uncharacterized protein (DUF885 family)
MVRFGLACTVLFAAIAVAAPPPAWIVRSNQNSQIVLDLVGRFSPEDAADLGMDGYDDKILDLSADREDKQIEAYTAAAAELDRRLAAETDPQVRQDLQITLHDARDTIREIEIQRKYHLPYTNASQLVFGGIHALLEDRIAESRRPAAVARLRRYAGLEAGFTPIAVQAEQRLRERLNTPGLTGPPRLRVEKDLDNSAYFIDGLGQLFVKYKLTGYEDALAALKKQVGAYNDFIRAQVLPRCADDFRLPPEEYAFRLEDYGVDIPPDQLAARAHGAFDEIQAQMSVVATLVAKDRGLPSSEYREVIRALKKDQFTGDQIMDHYHQRIAQIEEIVRRENLLTLPDRPARMRLASAAESAAQPAPHMSPPRLLGNTGESGEFILPLANPAAKGQRIDDFTFAAASWTLTSHEARPGHELQFSRMVESGVSTARAVFAFNSTNVEGWGLYSEWMMYPYMPADGQLISLQHRLLRAARAFLDPELQAGTITREDAKRLLADDVVLSDAMATEEVDRYTFRAPGQATSYFYGFTRLLELREDMEKKLGTRFSAHDFHDFILTQGLLPPALLRAAVMAHFN